MAQVKIYALRSNLEERRELLSRVIHSCVMDVLGLPAGKKAHRFFPLNEEDFVMPEDRSANYTILECQMMSGRTKQTKKAFINTLFERFEKEVGINKQDLEITLLESPPENWGFRGFTGDEVKLNYRVDV